MKLHWQGRNYQFQALMFGLSLAPWVFTKVLALVIACLRRQGIKCFVYLDNILIVGFSPQDVEWSVRTALQTLMQVGYIINLTKSDVTPV